MAKNNNEKPLVELTDESRKHLEEMDAELKRAEDDIAAIEEIGMDASRLREQLARARHAREVILKRVQ